jgi:hypothetical protein
MPDTPFATAFALAVGREVARRVGVTSGAVHAADRLPEEWGDPFIRESLAAAEFVMELEGQFGVSVPDWAARIFQRESVSVGALAADLCGAALGRRSRRRPRSWSLVSSRLSAPPPLLSVVARPDHCCCQLRVRG